jgi:CBS domain-containing protein
MRVRSILSTKGSDVATIDADATLREVADALAEAGIGALVVSADGRTVDGIVSERDLARAVARDGAGALDRPVHEVMATGVLTCRPHDLVQHLMGVMTEARVRHLPVVEDDRLVGIVSIGDVVKHCFDELQTESQALQEYLYSGR